MHSLYLHTYGPICRCCGPAYSTAKLSRLVLRHRPALALKRRLFNKGFCFKFGPSVCQAVATPSLPGPRRRQRHAMMNDYTVTIPFGIAATVGGLLSLPLQGGWTGIAVALAGGVLFTIGSMSHDRTNAGQESKAPFTLAAAVIAAALSRVFYDRAVIGVFGTMAATIVSAAVSLFLVYNVVLGGNKPQQGGNKAQQHGSKQQQGSFASSSAKGSNAKAAQDDTAYQSPVGASWWDTNSNDETSQGHSESLQHQQLDEPQMMQPAQAAGLSLTQYPGNVQAVATVTGVVLYAQGIWGLWGETVGYSPASMTGALASGLIIIAAAQTLLATQPSWSRKPPEQ